MIQTFSHIHWVKEIGKYIDEANPYNIIKFALSYTLQSLRANEDIYRFQWDGLCMISEEIAKSIASDYIDYNDTIVNMQCRAIYSSRTHNPISWVVHIHHMDLDRNMFFSVIEINNNGVVVFFDSRYVANQETDGVMDYNGMNLLSPR